MPLERLALAVAAVVFGTSIALAQTTTRVSVATGGGQGNESSLIASISGDGRFVAFQSSASNLVAGDTNGQPDVFVHDRHTGETTRVSVATGGGQANGSSSVSFGPTISADGRFVAFDSSASNLVAADTNARWDIFVHDRQSGQTTRETIAAMGGQANNHSYNPSITADGRFIAFESYASNLVAGDTNVSCDVFVRDRQTGQTTRVSVATGGGQAGSANSLNARISADGRFVSFHTIASDLVAGDTNGQPDVFVHDRHTGETTRVSVATGGGQGTGWSWEANISADGRCVAFSSSSSNLVAADTNGTWDIFVHDRQTGQTTRVNVSTGGGQASDPSVRPSISADGRFVGFHSSASNLVEGDTNGQLDVFVHDRQTAQTKRVSVATGGVQGTNSSSRASISAYGSFVAFDSSASNLVSGDTNARSDVFVHDMDTRLILQIDSLDMVNEAEHTTARYELNDPADNFEQRTILRRGSKPSPGVGAADIDVVVAEQFDPQLHVLSFEAQHAFNDIPVVREIPYFTHQVPVGQWGCVLREPLTPPMNGERTVKMQVAIPPDASVGEYTFLAVLKTSTDTRLDECAFDHPVVLLFNPWDANDAAYLNSPSARAEYVLNDGGAIWRGTGRFNEPLAWDYAQFDNDVFLASLGLLNGLTEAQRASPAVVSRWLTEKIDANDGGVIVGNWSADYSGGNSPLAWSSSEPIFRAYRASGAVRFGQCWVYAGLLTSSLRALGIGTRPVTNFESAHDTSMPPDQVIERCRVFDASSGQWRVEGEKVWNFHVWCESWMTRPDLSGSDGWQVVDATPQELSNGLYQLGPTPVSAVLDRSPQAFDGDFVLSEIDAIIQDQVESGGTCVSASPSDSTWVGRRITTKTVGSFGGVDITANYKVPETTVDPRNTPEVEVVAPDSSPLGSPLQANIIIHNLDAVARDYTCYVLVRAIAQNGSELGIVSSPLTDLVTIAAGGESVVTSDVAWNQLRPFVGVTEFIEFDVVVTRAHDEHRWFKQRVSVMRGLPLMVTLAPAKQAHQPAAIVATVTCSNPFEQPLDAGVLTLTCTSGLLINGLARTEEIPVAPLTAGATITLTRALAASIPGEQMLFAHWFVPGTVPGHSMTGIAVVLSCPADANNDGSINFADITSVLQNWGFAYEYPTGLGDANRDGKVNFADITEVLKNWGTTCP